MTPAHLITALAYYVIGAVLLVTAFRVWWTHPINRVFSMGKYLTPDGVRAVLQNWWLVMLFAAFILACAFEHNAEWLMMHGYWPDIIRSELIDMLGETESIISVATAACVLWLRVKSWRE